MAAQPLQFADVSRHARPEGAAGHIALYLVNLANAHCVVGDFEEEAVISHSQYLAQINADEIANIPVPMKTTAAM